MSGDLEGHRWGAVEHMLATLSDQIQQTNRLLLVVATQGKRTPPKFERHPRPGQQDKTDIETMKDTLAYQYLKDLRPGGPGEHAGSPLRLVKTEDPEPGPPSPRPALVREDHPPVPSPRTNEPPAWEDV